MSSLDDPTNFSAKIFGDEGLDNILEVIDPLLFDADKYKQRAGAEILAGVLRGKHSDIWIFSICPPGL